MTRKGPVQILVSGDKLATLVRDINHVFVAGSLSLSNYLDQGFPLMIRPVLNKETARSDFSVFLPRHLFDQLVDESARETVQQRYR